ncbi:MAG: PAS domain-containing protein [Pseudobacteriovorax sp.]|nr:PAS domain-containing protein [Pseudobacteriovorax sp.]
MGVWLELTGYDEKDLCGSNIRDYIHDTHSSCFQIDESADSAPPPTEFLCGFYTKNKTRLLLQWQLKQHQQVIYAIARPDSGTLSFPSLLERGLDLADMGRWVVDVLDQEIYWCPITCKIHGVDSSFRTNLQDAINFYVPEDRPKIGSAVEKAIATGAPWDGEFQILTVRGERRWVRAIGWPVTVGGNLVRLEGAFHDIHERKLQELELLSKHKKLLSYETALDKNSIISRTDAAGVISHVNDNFCTISGYSRGELIGNTHKMLNSGTHQPEFFKNLWRSISMMGSWLGEICNRAKDGSLYWLDSTITAIHDEKGRIIEYIAIRNDITQRKIVEQKFQEEKEKTAAANRSKAEFLATMSHEIRTPMNGVIGMAELLYDDLSDPEQKQQIKTIMDCGDTLISLINDILDYSKVEAGKMEVDDTDFKPSALLNQISDIMKPKAEENSVIFSITFENLPEMIRTDKRKVGQVLFNLIGNAIKFSKHSSVHVKASGDQDNSQLIFQVKDRGIGMTDDLIDKLFSPFQEGKAGREAGGTGLGLAICKKIADLLNGSISVTSIPGEGSIFTFQIPYNVPETESKSKEFSRPIENEGRLLVGKKVLVAEDNSVNRIIARRLLEKLGCTIDFAFDGDEAIAQLEKNSYDLALIDIHMPGHTGLEVATMAREQLNIRFPLIALTAGVLDEEQQACYDAGMDGFLRKPIRLDELRAALIQQLERTAA